MESVTTETADDAFANLATATSSDRQLMADLASTNKGLLKQLAEKDSLIAHLQNAQPTNNHNNDRGNSHHN
jgi:hypothetical protein